LLEIYPKREFFRHKKYITHFVGAARRKSRKVITTLRPDFFTAFLYALFEAFLADAFFTPAFLAISFAGAFWAALLTTAFFVACFAEFSGQCFWLELSPRLSF
jgi:hypothetical protein